MTVLLISHDRAFLAAVADHVLHFEADSATAYDGGYASFVEQRALRRLTAAAAVRATTTQDRERTGLHRSQHRGTKQSASERATKASGANGSRLSPPPTDEASMAFALSSVARGGDRVADRGSRHGERRSGASSCRTRRTR